MAVFFSIAAARRQIFVVDFSVVCCRFFLYHETLSSIRPIGIKAFAFELVIGRQYSIRCVPEGARLHVF
jgi:hypothetical protein